MIACPLCENSRHIIVNSYNVDELRIKWRNSVGFDPFAAWGGAAALRKLRCTECGLMYFDPPFFGDSKFYERLSLNEWYYESRKWEYDEAADFILRHKPASLLEIGCGSGVFLEKIAGVVPDIEGVDINEEALRVCKEKGLKAQKCDISATAACDVIRNKYDMVVLFEVIEHLDNPREVFRFIDDILADNGTVIMAMPNPAGYFKYLDAVLLDMPPHHNTAWPKEVFDYIARQYEWSMTGYATEPLRYVHYVMYLSSIAKLHALSNSRMINAIVTKLTKLAINVFAPFYYATDQKNILGQTHLVVFQKSAEKIS